MKRVYLVKRIFDIIFAVLFVIFFWWIYLLAIIGIKLSSKGPVLYVAQRVGKNGEIFDCYKFRSMKVASGKIRMTTLATDERIFPFGKFIRVTKIDEMPQIFNILKGDMSVVGPRPEDKSNADAIYKGEYKKILDVLPGLTSPASLYDYTHGELYEDMDEYERVFIPQKLQLELHYVNHCSFKTDMVIILQTGLIILAKSFGYKNFKKPKEFLS